MEVENYEELNSSRRVTMVFDKESTVLAALEKISKKSNINIGGNTIKDFGLFIPFTYETEQASFNIGGFPMDSDRVLSSFGLSSQVRIYFAFAHVQYLLTKLFRTLWFSRSSLKMGNTPRG